MTITNMQQPMQMQRGLGSLQDPRQNYGLGSFVKKAIRGVKKVVKSPLGKLALGAAAGYGLHKFNPGMFAGMKNKFMSGKGFLGGVGNIFGKQGDITKGLSMGRVGL